jgi:hypothetical protein
MLTAQLQGQLGNQLFQVAAAWTLALDNDDLAAFDFSAALDGARLAETVFRNVSRGDYDTFGIETVWSEPDFGYHPIPYQPATALAGYFQSERYFAHRSGAIRVLFALPPDAVAEARAWLDDHQLAPGAFTVVHVRRGDYRLRPLIHPLLPHSYYRDALARLVEQGVDFPVVAVSDEPDVPRAWDPSWIISSGQRDLVDLALCTLAGACVIANSSFSWWGAWLNDVVGPHVVAPVPWFGPDGPEVASDIVPDRWTELAWSDDQRSP